MEKETEDKAKLKRETVQLLRLRRLIDVVYAIVLWNVFLLIPEPDTGGEWNWDMVSSFLSANILTLALVAIALAITIIFWLQNNTLFNNLDRTDGRHTASSILQIFFMLLFLHSIRMGVVLGGSVVTRAFESSMAALMGITAAWGWSYANKNRRLVSPDVTEQYARRLKDRILAEPITAIITLPLAFVGPVLWEIAWLSYPLVVFLVRHWRRAKMA